MFFFKQVGNPSDKLYEVSKFMKAIFQLDSTSEAEITTEEEYDDLDNEEETSSIGSNIRMNVRIRQVDVRRDVVDFGRCFLAGSIAGGALGRNSAVGVCDVLTRALDRFAGCSHAYDICIECAKDLMRAGKASEE